MVFFLFLYGFPVRIPIYFRAWQHDECIEKYSTANLCARLARILFYEPFNVFISHLKINKSIRIDKRDKDEMFCTRRHTIQVSAKLASDDCSTKVVYFASSLKKFVSLNELLKIIVNDLSTIKCRVYSSLSDRHTDSLCRRKPLN